MIFTCKIFHYRFMTMFLYFYACELLNIDNPEDMSEVFWIVSSDSMIRKTTKITRAYLS
jgi:hypothetical protein